MDMGAKKDAGTDKKMTMGTAPMVIERVFDAPRKVVWKAWTDPEWMTRWWGPTCYTAQVVKIDLRVGGKYLIGMRDSAGKMYWSTGTYREIMSPRRFVATDSFADEHGKVVPAAQYGLEGEWPLEMVMTVTFDEHMGQTKVTLSEPGMPAGQGMEQTKDGWMQSFDKLDTLLMGVQG